MAGGSAVARRADLDRGIRHWFKGRQINSIFKSLQDSQLRNETADRQDIGKYHNKWFFDASMLCKIEDIYEVKHHCNSEEKNSQKPLTTQLMPPRSHEA